MPDFAHEVLPLNLEDEMRQSYLDYAMSVIVGRALPDVRDGLKPVHRRILYAMHETNNVWNRPYVKCARVVGDVMGKYHPHGDSAIYDALVRMAQDFSLRYPLIDGQGNFGSIDADPPAAMRYTECRMARIASDVLADIDKETVEFVPNYDEKEQEPTVLPTRVPNLLVNGSSGIAVGMATNIPPHNLGEVVDALLLLVEQPDATIEQVMEHLPGPDFPTGGIINGARGIHEAYRTGRGRVYVRALANIEDPEADMPRIIVTELPYQVNKARLLEKIAELVKEKKLEGIRPDGLRDESDKDGLRIVIELKRGENAEVFLNNLYQLTQMQQTFSINMVALVDAQPRTLNLLQVLLCFLRHRREVVTRRSIFELRKARDKAHILEGLAVAIANIDPVIALIKASPTPSAARSALQERAWEPGAVSALLERADMEVTRPEGLEEGVGLTDQGYRLSAAQAQAILELRLQKLTGLEQEKITEEFKELVAEIRDLIEILSIPERLLQVVREEFEALRETFSDDRRTRIEQTREDLSIEDLIAEEDVVVTLSHEGYAKSQPLTTYRSQRRGGRGRSATKTKSEDFVDKLFVASTHDTLLCFSTRGKCYWLKVFELPQGGPTSRGKPMVNLLPLEAGERITAVLPTRDYPDDRYIFMATASGTVKKTPLVDFSRPRTAGIIAVDLTEDDQLVGVSLTDGNAQVLLFSSSGKAINFAEGGVRAMGRTARGVRGIRLSEGQKVIALMVPESADDMFVIATENGYGKRCRVADFPVKGRGGQGVIAIQTSDRNGGVVGAIGVTDDEEAVLISNHGTLVRMPARDISVQGRNTQGVTLVRLADDDEKLVSVDRAAEKDDGNGDQDDADTASDSEDTGVGEADEAE